MKELQHLTNQSGQGFDDFDHFSVDFWDDTMFLKTSTYPCGYFVVSLLNINQEELNKTIALANKAKSYIEKAKTVPFNKSNFIAFGEDCKQIFGFIAKTELFSLLNVESAQSQLEDSVGETAIFFLEGNRDFLGMSEERMKLHFQILDDMVLLREELSKFYKNFLSKTTPRNESSFADACNSFFWNGNSQMFYSEQIKSINHTLTLFPKKTNTSMMSALVPHPTEEKFIFIDRLYFDGYKDFIVTDFMKCLHYGNSFGKCEICGRYFLNEDARNPKYCDGYVPNHPKGFTCRQDATARGRKEKEHAPDHPIKAECTKRLNTINKHRKSGIISEDFADLAKRLAQEKRDKALFDNEYFLKSYKQEISQDALYTEVKLKLK